MLRIHSVLLLAGACGWAFAADAPSVSQTLDSQLSIVQHELVPLAEAMPADKFDFAPAQGEFKGVRTFGRQVSHVAAVMYLVSAAVLGEKVPAEAGEGENGPATLKSKDDYLSYLNGAFAYTHKAIQKVTEANMSEMVKPPFGSGLVPRLSLAMVPVWHSFDHYGQMAVYARMNGVIPPASRQ